MTKKNLFDQLFGVKIGSCWGKEEPGVKVVKLFLWSLTLCGEIS